MKIKELIEALQAFDGDVEVCTNGYEGGYCFIRLVKPMNLLLDCNTEWYYGPHEDASDSHQRENFPDNKTQFAIYIG